MGQAASKIYRRVTASSASIARPYQEQHQQSILRKTTERDALQRSFLIRQQQQGQRQRSQDNQQQSKQHVEIVKGGRDVDNNDDTAAMTPAASHTPTSNTSATTTNDPTEMPQDLIDFLTSAGPLRREEEKAPNPSSKQQRQRRMPKGVAPTILDDEAEESSMMKKDTANSTTTTTTTTTDENRPKQTSMRLVEDIEGYETMRTTHFSTKTDDDGDGNDADRYVVGDVIDFYELLRQYNDNDGIAGRNNHNTTTTQTIINDVVQTYCEKKKKNQQQQEQGKSGGSGVTAAADTTDSDAGVVDATTEHKQQQEEMELLLRKTLGAVYLPVLMKDTTDGSYIGTYPSHAIGGTADTDKDHNDQQQSMSTNNLQPVSEEEAILVIQDLATKQQGQ